MTALKEFDRLEAMGLWRPTAQAQRREVVVSLGDATLTMSDIHGTALAHWSLGAVIRANGTERPALYHPDGDPGETLELPEDEAEMIDGIDRLLRAIERRRPRPGKLRYLLGVALAAGLAAGAVFWLPDALARYTVNVVPPVKRAEIGQALLTQIARVTGQPCANKAARAPLNRLGRRILGPDHDGSVYVLPMGLSTSAHLPGGLVLLGRSVVEDHEDPDVAAGFILAERQRAAQTDPLAELIAFAGLGPSLRLLTTGALPSSVLASYAEHIIRQPPADLDHNALLDAFAASELRSTPYAFAIDITGESVLTLIEADPRRTTGSRPVLSDADWLRLQNICGG